MTGHRHRCEGRRGPFRGVKTHENCQLEGGLADVELGRFDESENFHLGTTSTTGQRVHFDCAPVKLYRTADGRIGFQINVALRSQQGQMWMLTLYAKDEEENIPGHILKKIKEEIDGKG